MKFSRNLLLSRSTSPFKYANLFTLALLLLSVSACNGPSVDSAFTAQSGIANVEVSYSTGLRIEQVSDGYKVVVRNPQDTTEILGRYHFSRKLKSKAGAETVVRIPITNAALNSTTFVPFFAKLDAHDKVGGVSYALQVTNEKMKARIDAGKALEIAGGDGLDLERVLMVNPDVLMAYKYGESNFQRVEEQGIPVVLNMEYLESKPLSRAEWVKFVGCLLDRYAEANAVFQEVEAAYNDVKAIAKKAGPFPTVFSGSKYDNLWFAPGNRSFVAQFIRDAGAIYAFQHIEGQGNTQLDFESVLATIAKADYWGLIVSSPDEFTLSNLLAIAPEYSLFESFKKGQVFVCNTAKSDYFGDAVMEPHVILADLVAIIHPGTLPDHKATYFRPVEVDLRS